MLNIRVFVNKALIRLTGHDVKTGESPSDVTYHGLPLIGASVAFGATIACVNMGLLGSVLADGKPPAVIWLVIVAMALIGLCAVLVMDRAAIQFSDTIKESRRWNKWLYIAIRAVIVLIVSSLTSQAVMPLLLKPELTSQALEMRERSDYARNQSLTERFKLKDKQVTQNDASAQLKSAQDAAKQLPKDIQDQLAVAKACWAEYSNSLRAKVNNGIERSDAKSQLSDHAARCHQQQTAAVSARDAYFKQTREAVVEATIALSQATKSMGDAQVEVRNRTEAAAATETEALTYRSATVLQALLHENPAARIKWLMVTVFLVVFEILPMLLKMMGGQSVAGHRLMVERECAIAKQDAKRFEAHEEHANRETMAAISIETAARLRYSEDARKAMEQTHLALLHAHAPIEAMHKIMQMIREQQAEVDEFITEYPRFASAVSDAWNRTIKQATAAMVKGVPLHATQHAA